MAQVESDSRLYPTDPKTSLDGCAVDRARSSLRGASQSTSENFRFLPVSEKPRPTGNGASDPTSPGETAVSIIDDGLCARKRLALSCLLCGQTSSSVAARLGVSVRTIYNWRHEPAFAAQLNARSAEALETNAVRARNLLLKSSLILNDALNSRERFNWALKLVNANRLWLASQQLPAFEETQAMDEDRSSVAARVKAAR